MPNDLFLANDETKLMTATTENDDDAYNYGSFYLRSSFFGFVIAKQTSFLEKKV